MEQAEQMCDRVAIIARGTKVLDGALAEVKAGHGARHVALTFGNGSGGKATRILQDRSLVARVDDAGSSAELELAPGARSQDVLRNLVQADVELLRFEVVNPSLRSIFISKVGAEAAVPVASEAHHA
jgi:ABC-2 type transport system ATP-binding protein